MLEELRIKLLSSRDKFILSSKDTLPDFEPLTKKLMAPGLVKQGSIASDYVAIKDEKGVLTNGHSNGSR